jgi:hypothetical protein
VSAATLPTAAAAGGQLGPPPPPPRRIRAAGDTDDDDGRASTAAAADSDAAHPPPPPPPARALVWYCHQCQRNIPPPNDTENPQCARCHEFFVESVMAPTERAGLFASDFAPPPPPPAEALLLLCARPVPGRMAAISPMRAE